MHRLAIDYLAEWKDKAHKKPLIIRGARQVGKSYLVRQFAKEYFTGLIEINFERNPERIELFKSNNPQKIIQLLELEFNKDIITGKTILFLDEIQSAPPVLACLRYFCEELQDFHVIGAGSLLEFLLNDHAFSMPVGRLEYMHLGPMNFEEFLIALGKIKLLNFIASYNFGDDIPEVIHNQLMEHLKTFMVTGGMPEIVSHYVETKSFKICDEIKHSIISTYKDDFSKYGKKIDIPLLHKIFNKIPFVVGNKVKFVNIDREEKPGKISKHLKILNLAKVISYCNHSSGNGVPLGAEKNDAIFKVIFLDVGLMSGILGLNLLDFEKGNDILMVNSGAICEQFIGQHLLYYQEIYKEPELFYWAREKRNSSAEIDYLISDGNNIVPVEVKSGKTGRLKSLQLFVVEKSKLVGVRFNTDRPSLMKSRINICEKKEHYFTFLSLPLYMVCQLKRLLSNQFD